MKYKEEFIKNNDSFDGCAGLEEVDTYNEWIKFEERLSKKYGENYVPSKVYLAIRKEDNKLVGIIDLRLSLSDFLLNMEEILGIVYYQKKDEKVMQSKCLNQY